MDIKPCPHCGGPARIVSQYSQTLDLYFIFVKCTICGATGKTTTTGENPSIPDWDATACPAAVAAWNMRTEGS